MIETPAYVLEEALLRNNLRTIRSVEERSGAEVIISFKAFAMWRAFGFLREMGFAASASSPNEAQLAKEELGKLAHTYSPAYTEADFGRVIDCSQSITFNSMGQYERFIERIPDSISVGIRVNPEYSEIETELYNPCAPGSRFGILSSDVPEVLPKRIEGFHVHCHCESSADTLERTFVHIEEKFSKWFPQLKWLNLGGGHLMTRADYDCERLVYLVSKIRQRYPWLKLILEPGSAFAWQTGSLWSSVVDIVENKGIKTAILDVSFTCHMPDCLEMPYQPQVRGAETLSEDYARAHAGEPYIYRLGGNSCLSGDFMGTWRFEKELQIGDKVVLEDMIHYTTVKTTMFNGIHHPSICLLRTDGNVEVLRKFSYEDYKLRMC